MENEYYINIDIGEVILYTILAIVLILDVLLIDKNINNEQMIKQEIIKQSKDYTTFKECTKIQNIWYCK